MEIQILVILLVALIIVGPDKAAEVGKTIGKISRNLRQSTSDFTSKLTRELDVEAEEKAKSSQATKPQGNDGEQQKGA